MNLSTNAELSCIGLLEQCFLTFCGFVHTCYRFLYSHSPYCAGSDPGKTIAAIAPQKKSAKVTLFIIILYN